MRDIKFDFNHMFSSSVGKHGVEEGELAEYAQSALKAHLHLRRIITRPKERRELGLEWAMLPWQEKKPLRAVKELSGLICEKYHNVIFLGIGGSYLGLKAAQDALGEPYYNEFAPFRKNRPRVYFEGNNLDPNTLFCLLQNLDPRKTFVVVTSKSGETTETSSALLVVERWLKKGAGKNYGRQLCAITDPDSGALRQRVNTEQKKDRMSFRSLPFLKGVGGRFSELNIGLLHLALIGIDIEEALEGARAISGRLESASVFRNPAYLYALLHTILYRKKQKSIALLMPFSEMLKSTADWYVQLLSESLGKKYARRVIVKDGSEVWEKDKGNILNIGRTPISCRGTGDLHSLQQNNIEGENNKVVTFIRVEKFKHEIKIPANSGILSGSRYSELMRLAEEATEWALAQESRPNCTVILPEISAYHWAGLLFFFEMATAFEAELLNINAFDQPGVEGYKNYMYYKLGTPNIPEEIAEKIKGTPLIKDPKYIL